MGQLVITIRHRRSSAGVALSAALHLAFAIGAIAFTRVDSVRRPLSTTKASRVVLIGPSLFPAERPGPDRPVALDSPVEAVQPVEPPVLAPSPPLEQPPLVTSTEPPETESPNAPAPVPSTLSAADLAPLLTSPAPVGPLEAGRTVPREETVTVGSFERVGGGRIRPDASPLAAVAPAGFGSATARRGGQGLYVDAPRVGGFDRETAAPRPVPVAVQPVLPDTPVEIVFKPDPHYTDEARALKVEGTVVLDVEFVASAELRVLRVVRSLGHGLDEAAARAAERIRFRPARRGGILVDSRATVHFIFRLT